MFGVGFNIGLIVTVRAGAAILCTGLAVKLMDDFLDLKYDSQAGIPSPAVRLGEATLPYGLILLALGAAFHAPIALALFIAAYAVGMVQDLGRPLPSGLAGWQESVVVLGLGALLLGPVMQIWGLAVMVFVQAIDDVMDYELDQVSGNPNLVRRFGWVEVNSVALGCFILAALLHPIATGLAIAAVATLDTWVWRLALRTKRDLAGTSGPLPKGWLP